MSDDALDAFLRANRPVAPAGLARRLAQGALDPAVRARLFWADAADAARLALRVSAAALVLAAGLAFTSAREPEQPGADVAVLSPSAALRLETEYATAALLGEE